MARAIKQPESQADILKKISNNINSRLKSNDTEPKFRDVASQNDGNVKHVLKDFYKVSNMKNKALVNAVNRSNQDTAKKLDSTNTLLQKSISIQEGMIKELQNLGISIKQTSTMNNSTNIGISKSISSLGKQFKYTTTALGRKGLGKVFGKSIGGKIGLGLGVAGAAAAAAGIGTSLWSHYKNKTPTRTGAGSFPEIQNAPSNPNPGAQNSQQGKGNGTGNEVSTGSLKGVNTNQLAFIRGIGATESSYSRKEAYSETLNQPHNNANVRKYGQDGADYGYYQNNELDVKDAIRIGVPPEIAIHLHGGGSGGTSTIEQQTHAMHEYLKRKYPQEYEGLKSGRPEAFEAMRSRTQGKWFGLKDNPNKAREEFKKGGGRLSEIFPEIKEVSTEKTGGLTPEQSQAQAEKFGGRIQEDEDDATQVKGGGGADNSVGSSAAADLAEGMVGKHEKENNEEIRNFLSNGGVDADPASEAWCASFVNSALAQSGIKGSDSKVATSFLNWGSQVDSRQAQKGDVVVISNGHSAGETGGHVGFATGNVDGNKIEIIAGNSSNKVKKYYVPIDGVSVRRAGGDSATTPVKGNNSTGASLGGTGNSTSPNAGSGASSPGGGGGLGGMGNVGSMLGGGGLGIFGSLLGMIPGIGGNIGGMISSILGGGGLGGLGNIGSMLGGVLSSLSTSNLVPQNPTLGRSINDKSMELASSNGDTSMISDDDNSPGGSEASPSTDSSSNHFSKEEISFFSDDDDWLKKLGFSGGYYPQQTKGIV
jgi:uncharacterized protein (TIGR02594 family)